MKLVRFISARSLAVQFGLVIGDHAVAFSVLQKRSGNSLECLSDSRAYLAHLPDSEEAARRLLEWGSQHLHELGDDERFSIDDIDLKEPIEIAALFDFGLTPRHLKNSFDVLMKYEGDDPQTGPILQAVAKSFLTAKPDGPAAQPEHLPYYKSNMNSIVGDGDCQNCWVSHRSADLDFRSGNVRLRYCTSGVAEQIDDDLPDSTSLSADHRQPSIVANDLNRVPLRGLSADLTCLLT